MLYKDSLLSIHVHRVVENHAQIRDVTRKVQNISNIEYDMICLGNVCLGNVCLGYICYGIIMICMYNMHYLPKNCYLEPQVHHSIYLTRDFSNLYLYIYDFYP